MEVSSSRLTMPSSKDRARIRATLVSSRCNLRSSHSKGRSTADMVGQGLVDSTGMPLQMGWSRIPTNRLFHDSEQWEEERILIVLTTSDSCVMCDGKGMSVMAWDVVECV